MTSVSVVEVYGSSWTEYTLSSSTVSNTGRFCTYDTPTPGTNYSIPIPNSGANYSYWKSVFLKFSPFTDTEIRDIRWYSDGNLSWSGNTEGSVKLFVGLSGNNINGFPSGSYSQATGTPGTTGNPFWDSTNGHPYYKSIPNCSGLATDYTSANPLWVYSGSALTSAGYSYGILLQTQVLSTATVDVKNPETFTFIYRII